MNFIGKLTPEHNDLIIDISNIETTSESFKITITGTDSTLINYLVRDGHLFINGVCASELSASNLHILMNEPQNCPVNQKIILLHLQADEKFISGEFELSLSNDTDDPDKKETKNITVYVCDDALEIYDCDNDAVQLKSNLQSFMLMRTNPKLTGNIKLVVDSEYHLYLDTFKVSSVLNNRIYRKYPISSEGKYPFDVKTVFSNLPSGEIFKLPKYALDSTKFYDNYDDQYVTDYDYGAKTNDDNLYSENMKILAPLHIGKNVPDFFCIFRYDGVCNESSYKNQSIDDTERLTNLIESSEVVKIFDLRTYTTIGQYINNYKNSISDFLYGSCYLQFIEQDNEKYSENYRQGRNSWKGIDISKGLITNMVETSYFANAILDSNEENQELFNKFILDGYSRNNVLYPYILNLEFMFNDYNTANYSMHRYFGLYLSKNEIVKYDSIISNSDLKNDISIKLDADDNVVDDSNVLSKIFTEKYADRIFFMTTNNDAVRIKSENDVRTFISNYVANNPDKNLCTVKAESVDTSEDMSFMCMNFSEPIKYGEHLKFIAMNMYDAEHDIYDNIALDIIASNDERLKDCDDYISPYVQTNTPVIHKCLNNEESKFRSSIYRVAFYTQSLTDSSELAELSEQFNRIKSAVLKFNSFISVKSMNEDTISFTSEHDEVYFQHIYAINKGDDFSYQHMSIDSSVLNYSIDESFSYDKSVVKGLYEKYKDTGIITGKNEYTNLKFRANGEYAYSQDDHNKVISFCEYEDDKNKMKDSIRYFSKTFETYMYPLSPDSFYFNNNLCVFSTFGYDALGWRYNNIVKFKRISDFKNPTIIYDNIEDIIKNVKHPIVKTKEGEFQSINNISVQTGYITDNYLVKLGVDYHTQDIVFNDSNYNSIISPFNVNRYIIDFYDVPYMHNYEIELFTPESASIDIMGIFGVKDIDMGIDCNINENVTSDTHIIISPNSETYVSGDKASSIFKNVIYRILSGSFNEFSAYEFIILNNKIYIKDSPDAKEARTVDFYNNVLTNNTEVVISTADDIQTTQEYSFSNNTATQTVKNFHVDRNTDNKLAISICPQVNTVWSSNGSYFDNESSLNTMLMKEYTQNGFFTEHKVVPNISATKNRYIKNGIDSFVKINGKYYTFKDLLTKNITSHPIKKLLILNNEIDTAVGYYNSYVKSIEFIYYGIKFIIKFNNTYYNQNLNIGEYNNYEVFIINDYNKNKNNEIYISQDEEFILFVNRKYDIYNSSKSYDSIIMTDMTGVSNGSKLFSSNLSVNNAPFTLIPNTVLINSETVIAAKSNKNKITNNSDYTFIQHDIAPREFKDMNISGNYLQFSSQYMKDYNNSLAIKNAYGFVYLMQNNSQEKLIGPLDIDYNCNFLQASHRTSTSYLVKENVITKATPDFKGYHESFDNVYDCYVINNGNCEIVNINDNYQPIIISTTVPNKIKYNYGYFGPKFYDIIEFESNDFDLQNDLNISLLLGNTKIKNVNKLNTYTGNKVFDTTTTVKQNYFIQYNKSIFDSAWDSRYYRLFNSQNQNRFTSVDGYIPGVEDKSFFGSRCMSIHNKFIKITDFTDKLNTGGDFISIDSANNSYDKNNKQHKIVINITQCMYTLFRNNDTFKSNWSNFSNFVDTAINNYIKNVMFNIFNAQNNIELKIYEKVDNTLNGMQFQKEPIEELFGWSEVQGYWTEFNIVNEEIILTVVMNERKTSIIHPEIKISRI